MSNLHVVAVLKAVPGSEDVVRKALGDLVAPTQAEEGCVNYALYTSAVDASTFITVEEWRSQEDLDAHMKTDHIRAALSAAGSSLAGTPEIHPLVPVA